METLSASLDRVLVFAPIGRDAPATADLLRHLGLAVQVCVGLPELVEQIDAGSAAVLVAEEGLFSKDVKALLEWVEQQPAWSDLPFILLTSHQDRANVAAWRQRIVTSLRNVSILERPVQSITLTSTVQAALRARRRQYEVRDLLEARELAAQRLEALVAARTHELGEANIELRAQMAERAKAEEALRHAQKLEAIGQLTGGLAHDFNNLLMVISGGLDLLERAGDPARFRRLVNGMLQAVHRGSRITRQLLTFSRRQTLKPETIDLRRQIGGMRELLERSLRGDIHVRIEFAEDVWPINVDPDELELVLLNLAVNARDAMPSGGSIVIHAENLPDFQDEGLSGDFVCLSVSDHGTGMPPEVAAKAFEPFFTTKEVGKGSGLGLSQAYGFATQSGGVARIASTLGQGTRVTLILPRSKAPVAEVALRPPVDMGANLPRAASFGCVLLVEDDEEVAALTTDMLKDLGYDVLRATSAKAALGALADGRSVDILFSDIMMPGDMNGLDLAKEIRNRRRELPVLLTSGYADAVIDAAGAAGLRVLRKPYHLVELKEALRLARNG